MKRRTLLHWITSAAATLPFLRVTLLAQPRDLTPESIDTLREVGATVLPASIGRDRANAAIENFIRWTKAYREGVPLEHGYGHPRLEKTAPSPVPGYVVQLAAIAKAAEAKGGRFATLDLETRRAILDEALTRGGVKNLPGRPTGQHVVSDMMAHYFRSSAANDECYRAEISRNVCRPIAITTKKPAPLGAQGGK